MQELWLPVVGYEGLYEVSNLGRIKRIAPRSKGGSTDPIKKFSISRGYLGTSLKKIGCKQWCPNVHTVVAAAFLGPRPEGMEINHKNGVKSDNRPENLEYVTRSQNHRHAFDVLGKSAIRGQRNNFSSITDETARKIKSLQKDGVTTHDIMAQTGASKSVITHIGAGHSWVHLV